MSKLWELTSLVRSKNAGPFELTLDIMCSSPDNFDLLRKSQFTNPGLYSALYHVPETEVRVFIHEEAQSLKISFPRRIPSGNIDDTDVYGGQFHSLIVELPVVGEADPTREEADAGTTDRSSDD